MTLTHSPSPVNPAADSCLLARKLCVVTTARHARTTRVLTQALAESGIVLENWPWDRFLSETSLPFGLWAIGDMDRVHPWNLELAAHRHDALIAAGCRVLNDPRHFLGRAGLIRSLHAAGINSFTCWLPALGERPDRFPVFLRTLSAHRGTFSGLLTTPDEAAAALTDALAKGHTLTDLGFIEYRAAHDPMAGHFQKHSAYRIGDQVLRAFTVNDKSWHAKTGVEGLASDAVYATELAEFQNYPHEATMHRVTDLAGVRFGRVDFAIVDGRIEVYEINSNPTFAFQSDHPNASRRAASDLNRTALVAAIDALLPPAPPRSDNAMVDVSGLSLWPRHRP